MTDTTTPAATTPMRSTRKRIRDAIRALRLDPPADVTVDHPQVDVIRAALTDGGLDPLRLSVSPRSIAVGAQTLDNALDMVALFLQAGCRDANTHSTARPTQQNTGASYVVYAALGIPKEPAGARGRPAVPPLTFAGVFEVNRQRCQRWHDPDTEPWTGADWSNAMCGEAGEAANVVKKLRRHETGTASPHDPPEPQLRSHLADEIADVVLYLGLLADHYGIDVATAVASKFNRVSERQGFPERIELARPA